MKSFAVVVVVVAIAASDGVQGVAAASRRPGSASISVKDNSQPPDDVLVEMLRGGRIEEVTQILCAKSPEDFESALQCMLPSRFSACAVSRSNRVGGRDGVQKRSGAASISAKEIQKSSEDFVKEMQKAESFEELTKVLNDKSPEERKPIIEYLLPSKFSACATNDSDRAGELFVFDFRDLNKYKEANRLNNWPVRAKKTQDFVQQSSSGNDSTRDEDDVLFMNPKHLMFIGSQVDMLINGFPMPCNVEELPCSSNNNSYTVRTMEKPGRKFENVNPKDVNKFTFFLCPFRNEKAIFDADDRINKLDVSKRSILHYAAKAGMHDLIAQMFAVQKEYYSTRSIYAQGIQTNGVDADGKTPLEHALPYPETVKALLAAHAQEITDALEKKVMKACAVNHYRESFNILWSVVRRGADPDQGWDEAKSYAMLR